jgi:ornithine decarboxylase
VSPVIDLASSRPRSWPHSLTPQRLNGLPDNTPFLICDQAAIEHRHSELVDLLPGIRLFYAVKCNSAPEILATVARLGSRFEVASFHELDMVISATGIPASEVLYSNTVKPPSHIAAAWAIGLFRFAFDSESELRKLATHAPGCSVYVRLAVADEHSLFPLSKKFGTSVDEAVRLLVLARELRLVPYGVTFHVGSQCVDPRAWERAIARCAVVFRRLDEAGIRLHMVDLGGGFPARYVDAVPPMPKITAAIARGLGRLPYRPRLLAAEPGRFLVAESGVLAATVIGTEDREGERWIYLDVGGYNGMMEAVQTGGQWRFPLLTSRDDDLEVPTVPTTVTGPSCDSSDTMFYGVPLPVTLGVGDRVYIGTAGAYTMSYASWFNGFAPPATLFVDRHRRIQRSSVDLLAIPA